MADRHTIHRSPTSGDPLDRLPLDTTESVWQKVQDACAAQPSWGAMHVKYRAGAVLRVRDYLVENADVLAQAICRSNGKTRLDALATEVLPSAIAATYYAKHAGRFLKAYRLSPANLLSANKRSYVRQVPWGVIGIISPWNYPFGIPFSEVVMGMLAGNAIVLKVASQTQWVGRALEQCFRAAGLPDGVFTCVNLPGPAAGQAFLEAGVHKLFFTGSVTVGKQLMAKAAQTLTPVCLELGGNDPMLVCPDADLQRAAAGATWAGMQNCGQSCGGVERVYVHRDVYEPFLELLAARVRSLRIGVDTDHRVDMGAMTTKKQMEVVNRHLKDAIDRGANIHARSAYPEESCGNFMPAMVLTEVDHSMLVMREETFGPIIAVMKIADMEEAVQWANASDLGLTASVWSRDRKAARRLAERIQAGVVTINDHLMSHGLPETPWGGFKHSGLGRTHGALGFAEMTQPQCIVDDTLPSIKRDLWWYPHGPQLYTGLRGILDLLYARKLSKRLSGCYHLMRTFPRMFRTDGDG